MKKRILGILLAGMVASMSLAGCGSSSSESSSSSDSSEEDGYSTEIDMDEDSYEVAIQLITLPGVDYSDYETQMEEAINAITLDAINCTIDIQFVWISEMSDTTSLAIAGDEKVDLICVGLVNPLSTVAAQDMTIDLNDGNLLENRGSTLVELLGDDLISCGYVDGKLVAVPAQIYTACQTGIYYNKTLADSLGIEVPETGTFEDLEEVLYAVVESGSDVMAWYLGEGTNAYTQWLYDYLMFGTNYAEGAILYPDEDLTIENYYASEEFEEFVLAMYQWRQDGLITKDTTDSTSGQDYLNASLLFCLPGDFSPTTESTYDSYGLANDMEIGYMYLSDPSIATDAVTEYMWGIAANCERPDKAMDMLNFIYENEEVSNILIYGLEGENYSFVDGSDTVVESNGTLGTSFVRVGDTSEMYVAYPADESYIDEWEAFEAEATVSPILGYVFDDADYQTEASVISNVIAQYLPTLQSGLCSSEEETLSYLAEYISALESAGINDVIAANQEQLDAFLAE